MFAKSPVKRIGRDRFVRNVLIAIGNSNDLALAAGAERLLDDESPLVRGAAVWALSQLLEREEFCKLAAEALRCRAGRNCPRGMALHLIFGCRAPLKRGIQYSRGLRHKPICHGVLDRPLSRTMTGGANSVMVADP